jgi:hypothetical protein
MPSPQTMHLQRGAQFLSGGWRPILRKTSDSRGHGANCQLLLSDQTLGILSLVVTTLGKQAAKCGPSSVLWALRWP